MTQVEPTRMDRSAKAPAAPARTLDVGTQVGRYVIVGQLGKGGMGIVYKAYDPELDRPIALKFLRITTAEPGTVPQKSRTRLLREAQALAKLSHRNVVSVYDVGTLGEDVFLAMELVEGKTLNTWLEQVKPSASQIIEALVAAGRGLAAAHRAGIVHRDFKPSNLMVGNHGHVSVLDFGLACAAERIGQRWRRRSIGTDCWSKTTATTRRRSRA